MKKFVAKLKAGFWFDELDAERNEIVFSERNKAYGAFALRKSYDENMLKALGVTALFVLSLVLLPFILQGKEVAKSNTPNDNPPTVVEPYMPPIIPKIEQKEVKLLTSKGNTFIAPKITTNPEQQDDFEEVSDDLSQPFIPGNEEGEEGQQPAAYETTETTGQETASNSDQQDEEERKEVVKDIQPLTFAQVMPQFKGGETAMKAFLAENLKYPRRALETGTQGKIYISFVVNTDGSITKVKVVKGALGFGCEEAALKVIEKMPNWSPGQQNGISVPVQITLPVSFAIQP